MAFYTKEDFFAFSFSQLTFIDSRLFLRLQYLLLPFDSNYGSIGCDQKGLDSRAMKSRQKRWYISVWFYVSLSFRLNTGIARVQASVAGKQNSGLAVLLGVSREPRSRPVRGWMADLFCVRTRGVGRGDFVTLTRVYDVRKRCKVGEFFLWARPARSMRWLIIITLPAELGGKWLTSRKPDGSGGWVVAPWTWLSWDSVQAPCMESPQIYIRHFEVVRETGSRWLSKYIGDTFSTWWKIRMKARTRRKKGNYKRVMYRMQSFLSHLNIAVSILKRWLACRGAKRFRKRKELIKRWDSVIDRACGTSKVTINHFLGMMFFCYRLICFAE